MADTPPHQTHALRGQIDRWRGAQQVIVWVLGVALPVLAGAVGFGHHKLLAHDGDLREQNQRIRTVEERAIEDRREMRETLQKILDRLERRP